MTEQKFENMEPGKCPICGAPFYAECKHMRKEGETRIQFGREDTGEALEEHQEHLKEMGVPKVEDIGEAVEEAFEKATEDEKTFIAKMVNEAIEESGSDPDVQKFLRFEAKQTEMPKEGARAVPVREAVVNTVLETLQKNKMAKSKDVALKIIRSRASMGIYGK